MFFRSRGYRNRQLQCNSVKVEAFVLRFGEERESIGDALTDIVTSVTKA